MRTLCGLMITRIATPVSVTSTGIMLSTHQNMKELT